MTVSIFSVDSSQVSIVWVDHGPDSNLGQSPYNHTKHCPVCCCLCLLLDFFMLIYSKILRKLGGWVLIIRDYTQVEVGDAVLRLQQVVVVVVVIAVRDWLY